MLGKQAKARAHAIGMGEILTLQGRRNWLGLFGYRLAGVTTQHTTGGHTTLLPHQPQITGYAAVVAVADVATVEINAPGVAGSARIG